MPNFLALATGSQMAHQALRLPNASKRVGNQSGYNLGAERPPDSNILFAVGDGKINPQSAVIRLQIPMSEASGFALRSTLNAVLNTAETATAVIHYDESGSTAGDFETGWDLDVDGGVLLPEEARYPVLGILAFEVNYRDALVNQCDLNTSFQGSRGYWYLDAALTERSSL